MMLANAENLAPQNSVKVTMPKTKTIEETYTKKTQLEHILLRPDTYIGSVEKHTQQMWVHDDEKKKLVNKQISYVPGLYKIFDEILVNAADNKQRDATMNRVEVTINAEENFIRVWNNGKGIPVVVHQEHHVYVPELIFGHLLTGSNFNDNEEKTTGGRNGYGSKLANIFSTKFIVETADSERGLKYRQVFEKNMGKLGAPDIKPFKGTDYTSITFYPDLARFHMTHLDEDIVALMSKRVYDLAGTVLAGGAKLSVYLNSSRIEARDFEQYLSLYDGIEPPCAFERTNTRWEIGVGVSDGSFQQVSFVNSISTTKGGCHVNYIADQITARLVGVVKKRNKGQEVKAHQIKNHLAVYVNTLVVNPAFDSQTKEFLTTKASSFGSTCTLSEKLLKQVEKSGIIDNILNWAKFKQNAELKKKSGSKRSKILGITKLDDANFAGTAKSKDCTLILTEGDSAKTLAISGLSIVGRDYYGVFPLKGKLLNVREASHPQIMKNEEIQNIVRILGLSFGKVYEDTSSLRYGHLMIMTDQDHDGSHIKGLLINFIHHFWPSLLKIDGFLQQFITPIVKCTKGQREVTFFTIPEYTKWKSDNHDGKGWRIKYYKGLGTSTAQEAKEYFSHLNTHEINFKWDENADNFIDMAFAKKRVEDRKMWLLTLEPGLHIDYDVDHITYDAFINKELILFSNADNERSIPHFMDGLKPSQRKVLFGCFKRNLRNEIKVAQLAGYISEHAAYHHGEASLTMTIIGMAQNFVGSNNVNLLAPCGQFGTRLMGGKDAASPRYVFTRLENITRHIFHPFDDPLLDYLDDDGQSIEPLCYVPVIPMVLVNGSEGIGTGWSTSVTTYNPRDIIANLRLLIAGELPNEMHPWYRGFTGEIHAKASASSSLSAAGATFSNTTTYTIAGTVETVDEGTVVISELPVGRWTTDYKQMLETMVIGAPGTTASTTGGDKDKEKSDEKVVAPIVKDFKENHTDTSVLFTLTIPPEKLVEASNEKGGLIKKFKLETSVSTTNMNLFDMNGVIRKFDGPIDVLYAFYGIRLDFYGKRKAYLLEKLGEEWDKLDNKVKFITAVVQSRLVVNNRKKSDLFNDLQCLGLKTFYEKKAPAAAGAADPFDDTASVSEVSTLSINASLEKGYDYLLGMKIWSLTMEKVDELVKQRDEKRRELDDLSAKSHSDLWMQDLDNLEAALDDFEAAIAEGTEQEAKARRKALAHRKSGKTAAAARASNKAKPAKKKASMDSDDDDEDEDDVSDFDSEDSDFEEKPKAKPKPTSRAVASTRPVITAMTTILSAASTAAPRQLAVPVPVHVAKPGISTAIAKKPSATAPALAAAAKKAPPVQKPKKKKNAYSDSDESDEDDMDFSDDDGDDGASSDTSEEVQPKPKARSVAPKPPSSQPATIAASNPKPAAGTKKLSPAVVDLAVSDDEVVVVDDEDSDFMEEKPKKKSQVAKKPAASGTATTAAKPKPQPKPAKALPTATTAVSSSSFNGDDSPEQPLSLIQRLMKTKASTSSSARPATGDSNDDDLFRSGSFASSMHQPPPVKPVKAASDVFTYDMASDSDAPKAVPGSSKTSASGFKPIATTTAIKKAAGASGSAQAGVKRVKKSPVPPSDNNASPSKDDANTYTPDAPTPQPAKKARAPAKPKSTTAAAPKAPKAPKIAKPKAKKATSDDEEVEFDDDDEEGPTTAQRTTPKPSRQRKTTNYATFFKDDSEDDEVYSASEEDDFSD